MGGILEAGDDKPYQMHQRGEMALLANSHTLATKAGK